MSKRRHKNKKAGPVKVYTPAESAAAPTVEEAQVEESVASTTDDLSAMLVADEAADAIASGERASEEIAPDAIAADQIAPVEVADPSSPGELLEPLDFPELQHEELALEPVDALPEPMAQEEHRDVDSVVEFDDASAALAEAVMLDAPVVEEPAHVRSAPIEGEFSEWMPSLEFLPDSTVASASPDDAGSGVEAGGKGKSRKERRLKLNKLQKHARSAPESMPDEVALDGEAAAPPAPEPEPEMLMPREPRIPAFAKLTEYQNLSLAHVPGLPEETDVPGHWRGVGFGIGGRRLVSAFEEVVEIIRVPQITHVPGTQSWMLGVANVRGTLLPVVDLKQFLEGERTVIHEGQRVLVVRQSGGNVAVLIDQLYGQRSFNDSQKSGPASESATRYGHFIKQVYRVGDIDWGVFSMAMLTRTPEFRQAAA